MIAASEEMFEQRCPELQALDCCRARSGDRLIGRRTLDITAVCGVSVEHCENVPIRLKSQSYNYLAHMNDTNTEGEGIWICLLILYKRLITLSDDFRKLRYELDLNLDPEDSSSTFRSCAIRHRDNVARRPRKVCGQLQTVMGFGFLDPFLSYPGVVKCRIFILDPLILLLHP